MRITLPQSPIGRVASGLVLSGLIYFAIHTVTHGPVARELDGYVIEAPRSWTVHRRDLEGAGMSGGILVVGRRGAAAVISVTPAPPAGMNVGTMADAAVEEFAPEEVRRQSADSGLGPSDGYVLFLPADAVETVIGGVDFTEFLDSGRRRIEIHSWVQQQKEIAVMLVSWEGDSSADARRSELSSILRSLRAAP